MTAEPSGPALARRLTTADAVVIGVGSMVGAGLFSAFAPAAHAAGALLLLSLGVAALVAFCNAASSAQYPTSGGTYVYGRERLGPWWGFIAGWGFVIGKTASCAAMALVLAAYVVPEPWQKPVAVAAVVTLAAVNYRGITRTARLTRVIVALVLALLTVVLVAVAAGGPAGGPATVADAVGLGGVLQGAAILFFAFAGYARIATLGERGGRRPGPHHPPGDPRRLRRRRAAVCRHRRPAAAHPRRGRPRLQPRAAP